MPVQQLIDRAIAVLSGPPGVILLAAFVVGCIALLRMDANQR
jgi:hypothetical protein